MKVGLTSTQSGQLGSQSYLSLVFGFVTSMEIEKNIAFCNIIYNIESSILSIVCNIILSKSTNNNIFIFIDLVK